MPILPQAKKTPLGIYIHVPFCRSKCLYCDFYSLTDQNQAAMDRYLRAVCAHIREAGPLAPTYQVDTVYFGGGTPSLFGAEGMAAILTAIRSSFDVSPRAEITFEANPDSVTGRLLRRLKSEGFNRVSLGIQSDNDEILEKIGRPHTYRQAEEAVRKIRRWGFRNFSVDLMYGLPGQTLEDWIQTVRHILTLKPEHISVYGLTLAEGTPMFQLQDLYDLADDDTQADMYLSAVELLKSKGYRHYEISNFAKKDRASRHNMKYWTGGEILSFGPGASSNFGGKRFTIMKDLEGYVTGINHRDQVMTEVQDIPARDLAGEYLMLRMRTSLGIEKSEYERQYLLPFGPLEEILEECRRHNLAIKSDGRWRLSPEGFLVSNSIISDLLLAQEKTMSDAKRI